MASISLKYQADLIHERSVIVRDKPKPAGSASEATRLAFEQYRPVLHRFLVRRLHSTADAQDLAQDVYLRFLQIAQREAVREPQAFLYRLASNMVFELRVRQRNSPVSFDSELVAAQPEPPSESPSDDAFGLVSSAEQLDRVLNQLPKTYQTVLLLRKRDGLTPDEIAAKLGLTKATVYTYLIRAIAQFKAGFKGLRKEEQ